MIRKWWRLAWWVLMVVVLGAWWRLARLGELPAGLNRDEAALAYNAVLLEQTGRDEWERGWPLFFESFGDQKLPGYVYTLVVLFRFLPLEDVVVRLPSAIAGIVLVVATYFLVQLLCSRKALSFLASTLVACSPIFIWYSRGAWEANLALLWLVVATLIVVYVYRRQVRWRGWQLLSVWLFLQLSFLTYNSPLLIATVGLAVLPFVFWSAGKNFWRPLLIVVATAVVTTYCLLMPVTKQKNGITIFSDPTLAAIYPQYRESLPGWLRPIAGSKYAFFALQLGHNVISSWQPHFWVYGGSHPWHQLSGDGHLSWWASGLIYFSVFLLIVMAAGDGWHWRQLLVNKKWWWLLLLLVTLVPAVITTDAPHATRSLEFFYGLCLTPSVALYFAERKWQQNNCDRLMRWRRAPKFLAGRWRLTTAMIVDIVAGVLCAMSVISGGWYWRCYTRELPSRNIYRQGVGEVLAQVDLSKPTLIRSPERQYEYIKVAWALKLSPELFWQTLVRENAEITGLRAVSDLLQIHFADLGYDMPGDWQVIDYNLQTNQWERK